MGLLQWRGVGVLVTTRGPQKPSLEKEAVKPKNERASGIVKSSVGDKTAGELRWEKPNARMGKEITEKYGKHKPKYNLSRRGTIAKKRNQRWNQIEAIMWEN